MVIKVIMEFVYSHILYKENGQNEITKRLQTTNKQKVGG